LNGRRQHSGGNCELERRLAGEDCRPSGTALVTTPDTLVPLITPIFAGLRAEHPEIIIELTVSVAFFSLTKRDATPQSGRRLPLQITLSAGGSRR
jgi:hypothetical protein